MFLSYLFFSVEDNLGARPYSETGKEYQHAEILKAQLRFRKHIKRPKYKPQKCLTKARSSYKHSHASMWANN